MVYHIIASYIIVHSVAAGQISSNFASYRLGYELRIRVSLFSVKTEFKFYYLRKALRRLRRREALEAVPAQRVQHREDLQEGGGYC